MKTTKISLKNQKIIEKTLGKNALKQIKGGNTNNTNSTNFTIITLYN